MGEGGEQVNADVVFKENCTLQFKAKRDKSKPGHREYKSEQKYPL